MERQDHELPEFRIKGGTKAERSVLQLLHLVRIGVEVVLEISVDIVLREITSILAWVTIIASGVCMTGCSTLPPAGKLVSSKMLAAPSYGQLAEVSRKVRKRVGTSSDGLLPVPGNKEALDYRLALIDSAQRSLDIQMFFWLKDLTGRLLLERVLQAADRGVRVRLMLDDFILGSAYSDKQLAALHSHPHVEVRIYNPFHIRGGLPIHMLELLLNPKYKNQRMHNKTIIADNSLAILSGRNIADHCFGYGGRHNTLDLGVIITGPVIGEIGEGFDSYWNSESSYDVGSLNRKVSARALDKWREKWNADIRDKNLKMGERVSVKRQDWSPLMENLTHRMNAGRARYVEDPPEIPCGSRPVIDEAIHLASLSKKDLILVSLYIVPDEKMLDMIYSVRKRGVRVRLFIPSIGSNHNPVVYNQYQKYRKILLNIGVEIHELKQYPSPSAIKYLNQGGTPTYEVGLHAKALLVDSRYCFIGTLNLDGRARSVNTEEGLLIDSPSFVRDFRQSVEEMMQPENTWRLTLDERGDYLWISGNEIRDKEPTMNMFQTALERVLRPFHLNNSTFPDQQLYKKYKNTR